MTLTEVSSIATCGSKMPTVPKSSSSPGARSTKVWFALSVERTSILIMPSPVKFSSGLNVTWSFRKVLSLASWDSGSVSSTRMR